MLGKRFCCFLLAGLLLCGSLVTLTGCLQASAAGEDAPTEAPEASAEQSSRFDSGALHIGVWDYNKAVSTSEEGAKSLVDFGADFVMHAAASYNSTTRADQYKWLDAYGLKVFGARNNLPYSTMDKRLEQITPLFRAGAYEIPAEDFVEYPCEVGDYLYDEIAPKREPFFLLRRIVQLYEEQFPDRLPFINLNPCYWEDGMGAGLGLEFDSYRDYIEMYCRMFPMLDYLCYDVYPFYNSTVSPFHPYYLKTLDTVAEACRTYGKDHWIILQAGANKDKPLITDAQLRLQVHTALAYGATTLVYANYTPSWWADGTSLWEGSTSKKVGQKTYLWDLGQAINQEVRAIGDVLLSFESIDVFAVGTSENTDVNGELTQQNKAAAGRGFGQDTFAAISAIETDGAVLVGCFRAKDGGERYAAMLVNYTDPFSEDATTTVRFRVEPGKTATVYLHGEVLEPVLTENDFYTVPLTSGDGAFVVVE